MIYDFINSIYLLNLKYCIDVVEFTLIKPTFKVKIIVECLDSRAGHFVQVRKSYDTGNEG